ncbi:serine/threonine-protein kinase TBK1-like isoform X2 [Varroa jacobsoni]|uniref:serine/threonine-protein kinase TBK1-like isoform X2 n=1 Tax=Varroa jacobsoni TaxID=62625 RepID=UPI000BF716D2|nr:serine/threonine-protein kinase TBK1-like isoform X2 [Varroa jacobsoni]
MYGRKKQGSRGMAYLRGSPSYVWSTGCILGRGATATVYQGVNKILVMELCTGGSLFSILDDPLNSYGLEEEEFLLVLKDLTAGMKHLRDNSVIHRDLKPGNIMKYVAEDGRSIYKLTDFGAARELEEDQQFMSLYGTEEYLHPAMYERAVLRKHGDQRFSSNVDLWSIGVTLYHVATGNLPFRPYGGRRNREVMHYITTKKDSGVISGVQRDHTTSSIEWSRDLPKSCLLSTGLQKLLVPILAGLMECDSAKMWSFDKFFNETTKILSAKRVHVFYVNECREFVLYLHNNSLHKPAKLASDITEHVFKQSGVLGKNQLVFFENLLFDQYIAGASSGSSSGAASVPETNISHPVFLFNRELCDVSVLASLSSQELENGFKYPDFNQAVVLDEDAATAKIWCSVSHAIKRQVERLSRAHAHLSVAPLQLAQHLETLIGQLRRHVLTAQLHSCALERQLALISRSERHIADLRPLVPTPCAELDKIHALIQQRQQNVVAVSESLKRADQETSALETKVVGGQPLYRIWKVRKAECGSVIGYDETAATYVNKIRENWQALARDKMAKTLSYHDEQFHVLEKHKMQQTSVRLMSLLQDRSLTTTTRLAQAFHTWYREALPYLRQATQLGLVVESFGNASQWHAQAAKTEDEFDQLVSQFVNVLKARFPDEALSNGSPPNGTMITADGYCSRSRVSRTLLIELQELKRQQHEILQIVEDSQEIMCRVMNIPPSTSNASAES